MKSDTKLNRDSKHNTKVELVGVRQTMADIVFGMPSKKCNNYGICRIDRRSATPNSGENSHCELCQKHKTTAIMSMIDNKKIELHVLRSTIKESTMEKHFSSDRFSVKEDYNCNTDICKELGVETLLIKKGKYRIKKTKSFIKIKF